MPLKNEVLADTYQVIQEIGRGGTGIVYLAYHLHLKKYVVLKRISTGIMNPEELRRETDILKDLHHPYIPQVYDFLMLRDEVYTIMDYIEGSNFSDLPAGFGVFSESDLKKWFRQLGEVLNYLHSQNPPVIHSDIKPGNIILRPNGDICLIDFNISIGENQKGKVIGYSRFFASPEQVDMASAEMNGIRSSVQLDARTDIYSLGAVFYYLMTGTKPDREYGIIPLTSIHGLPYSPGFASVVDKAMAPNRYLRFQSSKKMLSSLDHLSRQDRRFKIYVLLQILCIFLTAMLLAAGVFCLIRGNGAQIYSEYTSEYAAFTEDAASADGTAVISDGLNLLNNQKYQAIFDRNPSDRAQILHAMGDSYYEQQDYQGAAEKYEEAAEKLPENSQDSGIYYLDYAMALSQCGKNDLAESVLESSKTDGTDTASALLMTAGIAQVRGDPEGCRKAVDKLLAESADTKLCARGCLIMAQMLKDSGEEKASWLEKAAALSSEPVILRDLGVTYVDLSNEKNDRNEKIKYANKALECYRKLNALGAPSLEDRLGLGIVFHMLGKNEDSIRVLKECAGETHDDCRIPEYLAFDYYSMKDYQNASSYCAMAVRLISELDETEKQTYSADEARLKELQGKLEKMNAEAPSGS